MLSFIIGVTIASLFWYYCIVKPDKKRFNGILNSITNVVNGGDEGYVISSIKKILIQNLKS